MTVTQSPKCERTALVAEYVLEALPVSEMGAMDAHVSQCPECCREFEALQPIVDAFVHWPTYLLRAPTSLWRRLAERIATETGGEPLLASAGPWAAEPKWKEVAPGISCKLLATDTDNERVSMLVRLARGVEYPPHEHAGTEELHLLDGELWIDERKLRPGDYHRAEAGTADNRVWSETGCTCVLITSVRDVLR